MNRNIVALAFLATGLIAACGGGEKAAAPETTKVVPNAGGAPTGENLSPDPGGKVVVVEVTMDPDGTNKFVPSEVLVKRGDVIRYTLKMGVHNVDFVADSNPSKAGLPTPSDMLQLPGQTYDVKVSLAPGRYYFQCDPHALLGMKGHVVVK